jgi:hypothetical protein
MFVSFMGNELRHPLNSDLPGPRLISRFVCRADLRDHFPSLAENEAPSFAGLSCRAVRRTTPAVCRRCTNTLHAAAQHSRCDPDPWAGKSLKAGN